MIHAERYSTPLGPVFEVDCAKCTKLEIGPPYHSPNNIFKVHLGGSWG